MAKQLDYEWRLRILLAEKGIFSSKPLVGLLADRGIRLSDSQAWRLVTGKPERLSLQLLVVLCEIVDCTPNDLIRPTSARARCGLSAAPRAGRSREHRPEARSRPRRQARWLIAPATPALSAGPASAASGERSRPGRTMASRISADIAGSARRRDARSAASGAAATGRGRHGRSVGAACPSRSLAARTVTGAARSPR